MELVQITAVWCPACLIMRPRYASLKDTYSFHFIEYDYDMDEEIVEQYHLGTTLPVAILLRDGQEILRIIGEKTTDEIKTMIEGVL